MMTYIANGSSVTSKNPVSEDRGAKTWSACEMCGADVWAYPNYRKTGRGRFCSRKCYYAWRSSLAYKGPNNPKWERIERQCEQCGKGFWAKKHKVAEGMGRFCSPECYHIWHGLHVRGKSHPNRSGKMQMCPECGKEFYVPRWRAEHSVLTFCSMGCYAQYQSRVNVGPNHPQWQGGLSADGYSADFNTALKERVRERDRRRCQLCGWPARKRRLDVHHIDYDKLNNTMGNLISLCHVCHIKTNFNREYWPGLFNHILEGDYASCSS